MAPAEDPTTMSAATPWSTSSRSIPTCTAPKLPPPARTKAVRGVAASVAVEVFAADVVVVDAGLRERRPDRLDHRGRAGHVEDRVRQVAHRLAHERRVDHAPL